MSTIRFPLPPAIANLVLARNELRDHYVSSGLTFTLDGNLLGDLGEAIAAEIFGVKLQGRSVTGIDGHAPDGRSVQVKVTGTDRGPAFRMVDTRADHLLFFSLDVDNAEGLVIFNGPEHIALGLLPHTWVGQRSLTRNQIRAADREVDDADRLQPIISL
ncbi:DUF6998 domain-containing protein [Aureimonas glaciei]|uniref:DUF6998 domain-containing protein n=1 Tax=Aureimonas glaciei TaxID=1776957 RepID=UPI001FCEF9FF|nr:hypothetical protein [Aureimonas glaciei]